MSEEADVISNVNFTSSTKRFGPKFGSSTAHLNDPPSRSSAV
ncbi:MAG: hypothetical protein R2773_03460 [Flavobacteriaceae bacterium]